MQYTQRIILVDDGRDLPKYLQVCLLSVTIELGCGASVVFLVIQFVIQVYNERWLFRFGCVVKPLGVAQIN